MTLTPTEDLAKIHVTVADRDFGTIGSAHLSPDLLHARFLDADSAPAVPTAGTQPARAVGNAVERELAEAAHPTRTGSERASARSRPSSSNAGR
ncbi:hypothetical protein ACWD5F_04895 [Streptomyces sp. NPDC002499]